MADTKPTELRALDADPRYTEIPIPCMHCTHLVSLGSQFSDEGWTCAAYPTGIPYGVLTMRTPHKDVEMYQPGEMVAYDPRIYTEEDTGKKWHYTADGDWKYVDE